jgi:hypothetical protein
MSIQSIIFRPKRKELTKQKRKFFSKQLCHVFNQLIICLSYVYSTIPSVAQNLYQAAVRLLRNKYLGKGEHGLI